MTWYKTHWFTVYRHLAQLLSATKRTVSCTCSLHRWSRPDTDRRHWSDMSRELCLCSSWPGAIRHNIVITSTSS